MTEKKKADEESENHTQLTPHEGHVHIHGESDKSSIFTQLIIVKFYLEIIHYGLP